MLLEFDKYSLIIDGERRVLKSGALHYFRVFGKKDWCDRLSKLKAGGYDAVDLYFSWSFHSPRPNYYDFSDYKNIRELLSIAKELGLFVIARPGPYVNAELSAGGIPYWLLKNKNAVIRNRTNGDYLYSKDYMEALKSWYGALLPILKDFDNIVLIQIENEYSTNGCESEYIEELYHIVRSYGITVPIFHNDAYIAGLYCDIVDMYAADIYPYINPKNNWRENTYAFDTLDNFEDIVRDFNNNSPLFIAEMQAGWYDKWLGEGYDYIREDMNYQHINIMTKTALANGVTVFNHYMAAGGTNILDEASDEVYTSYDFAAPISEFGAIKENFKKAKEINYFLNSFNLAYTEPVGYDFEVSQNCFAKKRKDLLNNCEWVFLRNLNKTETQINKVNMPSFDMKILPENLKLKGFEILNSGLEIFLKMEKDHKEALFLFSDDKNSLTVRDNSGQVQEISGDNEDFTELQIADTKIIFVSHKCAQNAWMHNNKLYFNVNFMYADGRFAINREKIVKTYSLDDGFRDNCFSYDLKPEKIKLSNFKVNFAAPEIEPGYDCSLWRKVVHNDDFTLADSFQSDVYSEFVWYKGKISCNVKEISITARHIFAIYINGRELLNRNSYKYDNLISVDEHINIEVPDSMLQKDINEVTVLVQNLGFDKGFTNDINSPRGLVYFKTDTNEKIDWRIRGRICLEYREFNEGQAPYLASLTKRFSIPSYLLSDNVFAPFVLDMGKTPFRRATIFLNDVKIGRFIRNNANQEKFYLPGHFLVPSNQDENELKIVVWEKSHRIKSVYDYKNYLENVIIKVENFKLYSIKKLDD